MAALPDRLPIVCTFGAEDIRLYSSTEAPEIETRDLNCLCFTDDRDLEFILMTIKPHVIITFGVMQDFVHLMAAPLEIRRRWLHFQDTSHLAEVGEKAFLCYLSVCIGKTTGRAADLSFYADVQNW